MEGALIANSPTICSAVLATRPLFGILARSANVSTYKRGVMFVRKKLSSQQDSSTLSCSSADLSKMMIGPMSDGSFLLGLELSSLHHCNSTTPSRPMPIDRLLEPHLLKTVLSRQIPPCSWGASGVRASW